MKYVAYIPARGGSKSIPGKNTKMLAGKPLIAWTLDAALSCTAIEQIYVATDAGYIKKSIADLYGDRIIVITRSPETATDYASSETALLEFCNTHTFDFVFFIQATSPLLRANDLDRAVHKMLEGRHDSLLSVVRQHRFLWNDHAQSSATPMNYNPQHRPRRQDFNGFLVENGAFYVSSREAILNSKCRISGRIGLVEMDSKTYVELDEPHDWLYVENILQNSL